MIWNRVLLIFNKVFWSHLRFRQSIVYLIELLSQVLHLLFRDLKGNGGLVQILFLLVKASSIGVFICRDGSLKMSNSILYFDLELIHLLFQGEVFMFFGCTGFSRIVAIFFKVGCLILNVFKSLFQIFTVLFTLVQLIPQLLDLLRERFLLIRKVSILNLFTV